MTVEATRTHVRMPANPAVSVRVFFRETRGRDANPTQVSASRVESSRRSIKLEERGEEEPVELLPRPVEKLEGHKDRKGKSDAQDLAVWDSMQFNTTGPTKSKAKASKAWPGSRARLESASVRLREGKEIHGGGLRIS